MFREKEKLFVASKFLLFSQCFPQLYICSASNAALCGNGFTNEKILNCNKFKAFAGNKINVTQKSKFVLEMVENIGEKEKMLVTSIFSFSHIVFKRLLSWGSLKVGIVWLRVKGPSDGKPLNTLRRKTGKCSRPAFSPPPPTIFFQSPRT